MHGWLITWLIVIHDWLITWLIDYMVDWLHGWLITWLIDCMVDWLHDWLITWLIDTMIDWLQNPVLHRIPSLKPSVFYVLPVIFRNTFVRKFSKRGGGTVHHPLAKLYLPLPLWELTKKNFNSPFANKICMCKNLKQIAHKLIWSECKCVKIQ